MKISLAFLLIATPILFFSCNKLKDVEFKSVKNYQFEKVGFQSMKLKSDLLYYNPNSVGVEITYLNLDFFIDNSRIGHAEQTLHVRVPKRDNFIIPLEAELDTKNTIKKALNGLLNEKVKIHVTGNVKVRKAGISKSIPVDYTTEQAISIF